MPAAPNRKTKNKKPLTPLGEMILEGIDGALGFRSLVGRWGTSLGGLSNREVGILLIVREASLNGKLLNTVDIADRAEVGRKAAERALKKFDENGITRSEKIGREVVHFTPAGFLDQPHVVDRYFTGTAYVIAWAEALKRRVDALDPETKAKIARVIEKVKKTTFAD
jgi:hypothetical protein